MRCAGLGESVSLEDGHPNATEEVTQSLPKRRATGHGPLDPAAHRCPQFGIDQLVEQGVLNLQPDAGARSVE